MQDSLKRGRQVLIVTNPGPVQARIEQLDLHYLVKKQKNSDDYNSVVTSSVQHFNNRHEALENALMLHKDIEI